MWEVISPMKKLVIIGAGGFAREVAWLVDEINKQCRTFELIGYLDENIENHNKVLNGYRVLGGLEWLNDKSDLYYVVAVGNPVIKKGIIKRIQEYSVMPTTLIHPSVIQSTSNSIGEGCIICAGNIITVNVVIRDHVIINLDCTIGHDAVIEDYCTILPSVNISGNVKLGQCVEVGTGSAIIQGIGVSEKVILGAGSVVVKDIRDTGTYVGVPARRV